MTEREDGGSASVMSSATQRTLTARQQRSRAHIDITKGRGLEIGPLFTPLIFRDEADIRSVDILSADGLREHYRDDPAVSIDDIVDVDYVLIDGDTVRRVSDAVAPGAPFDWVVASHVIEHIPDLIGWLGELAAVMADGARLSLVVPDRRFCFDVLRSASSAGDMMLAHSSGDTRPSMRAVFDHFNMHRSVEVPEMWAGYIPGDERRLYSIDQVREFVARTAAGEYIDSHVWVFTPVDFVNQFAILSQYDQIDFAFVDLTPTPRHELEFYVTLERLPRDSTQSQKRKRFQFNFDEIAAAAASGESAADETEETNEEAFVASDREQKLILTKRRVLERLRGIRRT